MCACRSGWHKVAEALIEAHARADLISENGQSPLHWLICCDDGEMNLETLGTMLIDKGGAEVDAFAAEGIHNSTINFPDSILREGTPLLWAVIYNKPRLVSFLLARGANPKFRRSSDGQVPLFRAAHNHYLECLKLMLEYVEIEVSAIMHFQYLDLLSQSCRMDTGTGQLW